MADTYTSHLDDHRWTLVKSVDPEPFLDYLRSHHVVSDVDCETIQNHYVNQTRRARMGCFIDILRTKDPNGVTLFFTQLGWEYPHVYREIFRTEPERPPTSYRQGVKSRISCNLDQLLKVGVNMSRLRSEQESLTQQLTDMEAMVKHQRNEVEDLERENQRLRHFERDNQQLQERLRTLTTTNDNIKEENRQFLHEIRTLTKDLQKHRDNEAELQGQLDEVTQQIQEKSLELNRKKEEESDLRAKFEKARQQSLKIQNITRNRHPRPIPEAARQDELKQQLDTLMDDMQTLESTNKGLCEQLRYMQDLLDEEKTERDQMHRRVCVLEHEKGNLETRLNTALQKIERYYTKIKELEAQKMKLEEERMLMQQKVWETSQANERQFDQLHKLETRLDQVQLDYQKFRQEHRYCTPGDDWPTGPDRRPNIKARDDPRLINRPGLSPRSSPNPGNDDPFKFFTPFIAESETPKHDQRNGRTMSPARSDGDGPARCVQPESASSTAGNLVSVPQKDGGSLDDDDGDDTCSTLSSCSSLSSSIFEQLEISCMNDQTEPKVPVSAQEPIANFFIRSNIREAGDAATQALEITEGDILYVRETGDEHWLAVKVDKCTGQLCHDQCGYIPSMDRSHLDSSRGCLLRHPSCEDKGTLQRQNAVKQKTLHHQPSVVNSYTRVLPAKANRPLPVMLIGFTPAMLSSVKGTAMDWANIITDNRIESSSQLFTTTHGDKHNVIVWEARPKDHNSDVYKYIIIIISLQSEDSLPTLRRILGNGNLQIEFKQIAEKLKDMEAFVHRAGLHSESLTVTPSGWTSESFWRTMKEKVAKVQQQVFWLEASQKLCGSKN